MAKITPYTTKKGIQIGIYYERKINYHNPDQDWIQKKMLGAKPDYRTLEISMDESEKFELQAKDRFEERMFWARMHSPDCRDPDHPGCPNCEDEDD
jgi:hypothetical protein